VAEAVEDQSGHGGVVAFGQVDAQVDEVVHGERAGQHECAVGLSLDSTDFAVGFVVDLANQFLHEVLEGDEPFGRVVFVDNNRHLLMFGLHAAQGTEDVERFWEHQRGPCPFADGSALPTRSRRWMTPATSSRSWVTTGARE
jgi:hypothetical protein